MFPVRDLFEAHLTVADLERAIRFYRDTMGLELASVFAARRVAFFWMGGPGKSMLGLWESQPGPSQVVPHVAFAMELPHVLEASARLREAGLIPTDLDDKPVTEPVVLAWMPAAAVYFRDPDNNLLEFIAMLPEAGDPDGGIISWSAWNSRPRT